MKRPFFALLAAWVFLTRIPLPTAKLDERDFEAAPGFYPLVGLAIGAIGAAGFALGWTIGGAFVAAIFGTAATLLATGAFHEDGLADLFDGLGAPTAERMMEIMRDSRLGTFGAAALFLILLLKIAALSQLPFMLALAALPVEQLRWCWRHSPGLPRSQSARPFLGPAPCCAAWLVCVSAMV